MANSILFENLEKQTYARKEAFNSLRTNLQFCGVDNKVIMFTSCTPDEGKSTVALELARSFNDDEKKVVLVDADLRKSVFVGRYRIHSENAIYGLSHYLSGQKKMSEVINKTNMPNLDMIVAGPAAPNPTELLGKDLFVSLLDNLKENYDVVLIDCPPLGWVIDAAVVAPVCDGAILVVESGTISYRYLQDVKKQLEVTGVRILGTVLNKVPVEGGGYYNRYYSGHYRGYYNKYGKYGYGKYGRYGYGRYGKYGKYGEYGQYGQYGSYGEDEAETPHKTDNDGSGGGIKENEAPIDYNELYNALRKEEKR